MTEEKGGIPTYGVPGAVDLVYMVARFDKLQVPFQQGFQAVDFAAHPLLESSKLVRIPHENDVAVSQRASPQEVRRPQPVERTVGS